MSSSHSLYRYHRPRTFEQVVGQEHIVRTLRNAIEQGKVHHAYLFVGSRGTGKTSMAKILAACLNCEQGPTTTPCTECDSCRSIAAATSLDVIELDAASNNSVDDIRELREKIGFAPATGKHKVYILDEAHMLTTQAWNAFLKTLEEPPPNTVFVLATTEANKVLPTVVDRCHRFDFGRPSVTQIATVLKRAAEAEGVQLPEEAFALVARHAGGSFRDALGTLEQLVTYSGGEPIQLSDVVAVLGVPEREVLFELVDALAVGDSRGVLLAIERLTSAGNELTVFIGDLESHLRDLMVVQALGELPDEIKVSAEYDSRLLEQAGRLSSRQTVVALEALTGAQTAIKAGARPRIQLEVALLKATSPELQNASASSSASGQRKPDSGQGQVASSRPAVTHSQTATTGNGVDGRREEPPATTSAQSAEVGAPSDLKDGSIEGGGNQEGEGSGLTGSGSLQQEGGEAVASAFSSSPATEVTHAAEGVSAAAEVEGQGSSADQVDRVIDQQPAGAQPARPQRAAPLEGAELDLEAAQRIWPTVLETLRAESAYLSALFEPARCIGVAGSELVMEFPHSAAFSMRKADEREKRIAVTAALRAATGRELTLRYELAEESVPAQSDPAQGVTTEEELLNHLIEEFDAEEISAGPGESAAQEEKSTA